MSSLACRGFHISDQAQMSASVIDVNGSLYSIDSRLVSKIMLQPQRYTEMKRSDLFFIPPFA